MEFPGHPLTPHYWNCSMKTFILKIFANINLQPVQREVMQMGEPLECSMIAPGQSINPLQFTKLHNKTISKHFYESPTFASLRPAGMGCWSKNSL